jgi:hypothetical protein
MVEASRHLYSQGWKRFYHGLGPALIQGPLARFGDTAANAGILALLSSNPFLKKLPSPIKSIFASIVGALFRMILVPSALKAAPFYAGSWWPVDTLKTTMQTQGKPGVSILKERIRAYGIGTLWVRSRLDLRRSDSFQRQYGAWATAAASFVGSYPWFATYNLLTANWPEPHTVGLRLLRQATIGFVASVVSDTISNSLRVLKTYRQVNQAKIGYRDAARKIVASEGYLGLFGRGLTTRILCNGLQGLLFSVLWKLFQDLIEKKKV